MIPFHNYNGNTQRFSLLEDIPLTERSDSTDSSCASISLLGKEDEVIFKAQYASDKILKWSLTLIKLENELRTQLEMTTSSINKLKSRLENPLKADYSNYSSLLLTSEKEVDTPDFLTTDQINLDLIAVRDKFLGVTDFNLFEQGAIDIIDLASKIGINTIVLNEKILKLKKIKNQIDIATDRIDSENSDWETFFTIHTSHENLQ